jgi:hypothetical protein
VSPSTTGHFTFSGSWLWEELAKLDSMIAATTKRMSATLPALVGTLADFDISATSTWFVDGLACPDPPLAEKGSLTDRDGTG